MKEKSNSHNNELILNGNVMRCQACGSPLKKVSWKITAGAFDAGMEVEQTVFECSLDKNFVSIETSTGRKSEFAVEYQSEY